MATIVRFDPLATPQRVLSVRTRADPGPFRDDTDVVFDPDLSLLAVEDPSLRIITSYIVESRYWKHSAGLIEEYTQAEKDAQDAAEAAALDANVRAGAKQQLVGFSSNPVLLRALADVIKDEINVLRGNWVSYQAEVAAATNLANLQTRVAAMPSLPDRNLTQLRNAIDARVDDGTIDS